MKFLELKAVCMLLLLHSACFGECRSSQDSSNLLEKRSGKLKTPIKVVAQKVKILTRQAHRGEFRWIGGFYGI